MRTFDRETSETAGTETEIMVLRPDRPVSLETDTCPPWLGILHAVNKQISPTVELDGRRVAAARM